MPLTKIQSLGITDGTIVAGDIASGAITAAKLASGVGGKVLQVVSTTKSDTFTSTADTFTDITGLSVSITPTSSSSKILVFVNIVGGSNTAGILCMFRLVRGSTAIGVGNTVSGYTSASVGGLRSAQDYNASWTASWNYLDSPSTTSSTTYKVQGSNEATAYTFRINSTGSDNASQVFSYRGASTITVMEIAG
jgi:hypothetical protein